MNILSWCNGQWSWGNASSRKIWSVWSRGNHYSNLQPDIGLGIVTHLIMLTMGAKLIGWRLGQYSLKKGLQDFGKKQGHCDDQSYPTLFDESFSTTMPIQNNNCWEARKTWLLILEEKESKKIQGKHMQLIKMMWTEGKRQIHFTHCNDQFHFENCTNWPRSKEMLLPSTYQVISFTQTSMNWCRSDVKNDMENSREHLRYRWN